MAAGRAADRGSVAGYSGESMGSSRSSSSTSDSSKSSRSDSGSFGEGSMAAGRAADRGSVAGYSGDSRQGGGSSSRSRGGSFGEGSMAAGRAADRGSVAGYSGDSRQGGGSSSRSDGGSFGEGSMAAGRAADRGSVAGYSGDRRQQGSSGSFGEGSMAAARAADRASVPGYSGDRRVSRDQARSFEATINSMAAARAADRRSVPGYSADSRPSVSSAARVADAYAEYARSMLQAGVTLSGRPSSLPPGPAQRHADMMAAHRAAETVSMQALRAYEAKRAAETVNQFADWAVGISGAVTVAANQYGLNRAASILSKAAPFYTGTVASLTFSMGSVAQRLGAGLLAANIPGTAALGRALGYLGLSNPNIANTAAVREATRWGLSPQAKSTQALLAADRIRTPLSFATKATYFGALALEIGFRAYAASLTGKTREEMVTSGIIGGLKATDNAVVSLVGGLVGGLAGAGIGGIVTVSGIGAVPGALIGGVAGATGLDRFHRNSRRDQAIDNFFENRRGFVNDHVTPGVIDALDWVDRNRDWLGASFGAPGVVSGHPGSREPTPSERAGRAIGELGGRKW